MRNDEHQEKKTLVNVRDLKVVGITTIIILLIMCGIFVIGYSNATQKAEQKIAELENEIRQLSDPVAIYEEASKEIDIGLINVEIQEIGELATLEYLYTDAGKFSDPKELFGKEIPFGFTTKSFIAKWDGSIKAGVDVQKINAEINDVTKEIIIHIPDAEILSHELDENSFETLDEKDGLFNPIEIDDIRQFDAVSKEAMEKRAIENGILDKALENAKEIIYRIVNNEIVEEQRYKIIFKIIEE